MPPRLNKRQLREQEELEALAASKLQHAASDDEDNGAQDDEDVKESLSSQAPVVAKLSSATSAFAALNAGEEEEDEESEEEQVVQAVTKSKKSKSKKKKKKGKAGELAASESATATPPNPGTPPVKKGKGGVAGSSTPGSGKKQEDDPELDEIDRALAEIALKKGGAGSVGPVQGQTSRGLDPIWNRVKEVYSFDPKFLDSDAELRRMFGSKVINSTPQTQRSMHHARFANNPHHSTSIRRTPSYLAQPEPGWFPAAGVLTLSRYSGPETISDPGEWWTYEHSQRYREAQLGFLEVLQQADGNRLYNVLEALPYHVDTLMQLSEMMVQQGDLGASSTHLSKALYALSAPLPPSFPSGNFRLPYSKIENRAFFTGIARKVAILVKRGTWRTACEWAKIALGAGGEADPVGMLCFIDFLAPKAKQNTWFLDLLVALPAAYPEMRIEAYPGLAYAKALCLRSMEEERPTGLEKSTEALKSAILRFPMVLILLLTQLGGDIPPKILSHRRAQLDGAFTDNSSYMLSLLSQFYSSRSSPLWKEPALLSWLQKIAREVAGSLDDSSLEDVRVGERLWSTGPWPKGFVPTGVVRAAYISEIAALRPYLPPAALSGTSYSYDPIPPSRSDPNATFYDDVYLAPLYSSSSSRGRRRGAPAPGTGLAPGALEALRNQLMGLLGMGGEGQAVDLNPELREQLLQELQELARMGAAGEGVPGGFPGQAVDDVSDDEAVEERDEGVDEGEGEEDEENEERREGFLGRFVQYLRGGGGAPAPE
ncbi:DUF654-domain-containing protein [Meredithblackwellia eburnea MCA 4105]